MTDYFQFRIGTTEDELVRHKCLNEKDNAFNTKRMRE